MTIYHHEVHAMSVHSFLYAWIIFFFRVSYCNGSSFLFIWSKCSPKSILYIGKSQSFFEGTKYFYLVSVTHTVFWADKKNLKNEIPNTKVMHHYERFRQLEDGQAFQLTKRLLWSSASWQLASTQIFLECRSAADANLHRAILLTSLTKIPNYQTEKKFLPLQRLCLINLIGIIQSQIDAHDQLTEKWEAVFIAVYKIDIFLAPLEMTRKCELGYSDKVVLGSGKEKN